MADLLFAVVTLAFFALMVAFAFACDRLWGDEGSRRSDEYRIRACWPRGPARHGLSRGRFAAAR